MFTLRKANSESGFMSVESIANALFYLIMIAVVTLVASKVMHSGKMATTLSALSMLRSNIQYVGTNVGSYAEVDQLVLDQLIPGFVTGGNLPTGQALTASQAITGDPDDAGTALAADDPTRFRLAIAAPSGADCRKLAYYGLGAGYTVGIGAAGAIVYMDPATAMTDVEGACDAGDDVILLSR